MLCEVKSFRVVSDIAFAQFVECTVYFNVDMNVKADSGAVLGLQGCTLSNSLEGIGLFVQGNATLFEAENSDIQGNGSWGVYVRGNVNVRLDKCTMASNKCNIVQASLGEDVKLVGCAVANGLEGDGFYVKGDGACVHAKDSAFQGRIGRGVLVGEKVSVLLNRGAVRSNMQDNVEVTGAGTSSSQAARSPTAWRATACSSVTWAHE
jgi:hypothetical protein